MGLLNPTPLDRLVDDQGRPYFLWDCELTLSEFDAAIRSEDDPIATAYMIGKMMRQAKPDDVFRFVELEQLESLWPSVLPYLGNKAPFWRWLLRSWGVIRCDDEPA